jgi:hypothetical protein
MIKVKFPDSPPCYSDGILIHFTAIVDKTHTIRCAISLEALANHFAKDSTVPLIDIFLRRRSTIEKIAERLIAQKRFENNRSILIRSSDC